MISLTRIACIQRPNFSSRRNRKLHGKEDLLRNLRTYADTLFQGWKDEDEEPLSNKEPSWFRKQYSKGPRNTNASSRSSSWDKNTNFNVTGGFDFCEDDIEVETIFRSAFGGSTRHFYWSFINDEQPQWKKRSSWHSRRFRIHEDSDSESESDSSSSSSSTKLDLASERRTLGLHPSGPLKLEDVKTAYRTCAMKWHPDRHLGSSKAVAEEKFKVCSAAYESLCTKLAAVT
ncbi:hypothetical protein LINPERPRIM_LOCUS26989 [Linum perenne]